MSSTSTPHVTLEKEEESQEIVDYTLTDIKTIHPSVHAFKGKISSTTGKTNVSVVGFPGVVEAWRHYKLASENPDMISSFQFMHEQQPGLPKKIVSIGKDCGTPLILFISKQSGSFWEYDSQNIYSRPTKMIRNLGRSVGSLLYRLHKARMCIGGKIMSSIFVHGDGIHIPLTLSVLGPIKVYRKDLQKHEFAKGLLEDLLGFENFITQVRHAKGMKEVSRRKPQKSENLFDFNMFFKLMPSDLRDDDKVDDKLDDMSDSEQTMMELSYFMCHTTLFWDYEQRFAFSCAYHQLLKDGRDPNGSKCIARKGIFSATMNFDKYTEMDKWYTKATSDVLKNVYKRKASLYKDNSGIVPFHRNALVHCAKDKHMKLCPSQAQATAPLQASDVDKELAELFPYAMPIAFFEFYETLLKQRDGLIQFLCDGGLDYSRYSK